MSNVTTTTPPQQVSLGDVSNFLSKDGQKTDQTEVATVLLQYLPCARYAVLEKIGDVFFLETQSYIIEIERQELEGLPPDFESPTTKRVIQIKKIQDILNLSVDNDTKKWAPMVFQWAVQTLSKICSQYGNKRNFSNYTIDEFFQLWLNCAATNVLIEITVETLRKIISKNEEICIKRLLNATISNSPHFDWGLAHICCTFVDILPYQLLRHALDAYTKQSPRHFELVLSIVLDVFRAVKTKHKLHAPIMKLFTESITDDKATTDQLSLSTVPFLLHMAIKAPGLFTPMVLQFLNKLTHDNLRVLDYQTMEREEILHRGLLRRLVDVIESIDTHAYPVLQFITKYVCKEDFKLNKDAPVLAARLKSLCIIILDMLVFQLESEVNRHTNDRNQSVEGLTMPTPSFLASLAPHTEDMSRLLNTGVDEKRYYFESLLILCGKEGGDRQMVQVLEQLLTNAKLNNIQPSFLKILRSFKVEKNDVFMCALKSSFSKNLTDEQVDVLLQNLIVCADSKVPYENLKGHIQELQSQISSLLLKHADNAAICDNTLSLLANIVVASNRRMCEYFVTVDNLIAYSFHCVAKLIVELEDLDLVGSEVERCTELLLSVVTQCSSSHRLVVRGMLEGFMTKREETFATEPEEALIKVELLSKNYEQLLDSKYGHTKTSVCFQGGLRLNKRKAQDKHPSAKRFTRHVQVVTLSRLLSVPTSYTADAADLRGFYRTWGDRRFNKLFPSVYGYTATLLVELVAPQQLPVVAHWPDPDFLKYTIERDLKISKAFDRTPLLWDVLHLIASARPSLYQCNVLVQSLLGVSLKFWSTNRNKKCCDTPKQLYETNALIAVLKQAGWLPFEIEDISDIFALIKPKEVFDILTAIWKYLQGSDFAPDKFIDRDQLGRPQLPVNKDLLAYVRSVIKVIFLRNIDVLGFCYHRFLANKPA